MKQFLIFSLLLVGCSFKNNTDKPIEATSESVLEDSYVPTQQDSSTYFYFQKDHEFLCIKKNGDDVNVYIIDTSESSRDFKRFRGEILYGDTVYIEWRDYNQFGNDKNLLFEPMMGGKPDALRPISSKVNVKACAIEAYSSFDVLIDKFSKSYIEIDSIVFNRTKQLALENRVFSLPKYLHLMDNYYSPPLFPDHQKVEIKAKGIDNKYYKYFTSNHSGNLFLARVRAIIANDGAIELIQVYEIGDDEQEALSALKELLKNIKAKNYSILNSPITAEISLAIILNKSL